MDLAKSLIRSAARAFYETKHILAVDALIIHSALRDDDMAHLLGLQTKELRKLCAKLEEHRLLAVHNRPEIREGMQRPISRTYYYIDFRQTIDAIKYRIYRVTKEVESMIRPTDERKDYFCQRCKSRWTQMEVLDNAGVDGFYCHKCGALLDRDDDTVADRGGHEMQSKLMKQLEPLLVLLPRIDEAVIPDNTFEMAFNSALPVLRNQLINPLAPTAPIGPSPAASTTVKGMSVTQRIEVDLTSNEEKTAAQQVAEAERKARLAEQNALPVWHTNSTVSGEVTALGSREEAARRERDQLLAVQAEEEEEKKANEAAEMTDEVAQYYAQLARDQQKAQQEAAESDEEDEDDDDDDEEGVFEDVTAPDEGTAPSLPVAQPPIAKGEPMERVDSSESGSGSGTSVSNRTPVRTGRSTPLPPPVIRINDDKRNNDEDDAEDRPSPGKRRRVDFDIDGPATLSSAAALVEDGQRKGSGTPSPTKSNSAVANAITANTTTTTTVLANETIEIKDDGDGGKEEDEEEEVEFEDV
ncbi:MAG: hypothetical protein M1823_003489 [Watsoniomyces obsoletus]|nr:MAG: hypothetical protein M1823_003489 [Watsoniomyces obsoletus]